MIEDLHNKIKEVYEECVHPDSSSMSTLEMLTAIENKVEEMFKQLELLPEDKVEAAQREKEIERRIEAREEKKRLQKLHQEERVRKALERAKAAPKKMLTRKVVYRSQPETIDKKDKEIQQKMNQEDDKLAYFFT